MTDQKPRFIAGTDYAGDLAVLDRETGEVYGFDTSDVVEIARDFNMGQDRVTRYAVTSTLSDGFTPLDERPAKDGNTTYRTIETPIDFDDMQVGDRVRIVQSNGDEHTITVAGKRASYFKSGMNIYFPGSGVSLTRLTEVRDLGRVNLHTPEERP